MKIRALSLVILLTLSGCASLDQAMREVKVDVPTMSITDLQITGISFDQANLEFTLAVQNPNPVSVKLAGFDYHFLVNNQKVLAGKQREGVKVAANQSSQMILPLALIYADIFNSVKSLAASKEIDYTLKAEALLDLPILGIVGVPMEKTGQVPVPKMPKVELGGIDIKSLNFTGAEVEIDLNIENPNDFDIAIRDFGYNLMVNGQRWMESREAKVLSLAENGSSRFKVPLHLSFLDMGRTLAELLTQQAPLSYQLQGDMKLDTHLPMLKDIAVPFNQSGSVSPQR